MNSADILTSQGILLTDQYQLTMAQLFFRMGMHETMAQFDHFYRANPDYGIHKAGFCINAGLGTLLDWMAEARFGEKELDFLRQQKTSTGQQLFAEDFLHWLQHGFNFQSLSLMAVPEGRVVHPHAPLTIARGSLAALQILETPLLNHLNYQTLIATKAARMRLAGMGKTMLEFGLRRAQGLGAITGTRAALIGGADYSSNVGASSVLGFTPKGTHAHSMVQAFMALGADELEAFKAFAEVYPDDCLLLVDTINTMESGVPNAIKVFEMLKRKGHTPLGIRLDSGDLAHLAIKCAKVLNEAGFDQVKIVLSNQLDEMVIWQIITQIKEEAPRYDVDAEALIDRLVYGVGTSLITSEGDPALDGVYKLVAIRDKGTWKPAMKISETPAKTLNPGGKKVWRLYDERGKATADVITLEDEEISNQDALLLHHPSDYSKQRVLTSHQISRMECLHEHIILEGRLVYEQPSIEAMRQRREDDLEKLDPGVRRIMNPHTYHVSLSDGLWQLKQELILTIQ